MTFTEKDIPNLKKLLQDTSDFGDKIFDYVLPLNRCGMLATLADFNVAIEKAINGIQQIFWTYEDGDGDIYDGEFKSREEAAVHAYERFSDFCEEELEMKTGQTESRDLELIKFTYDDDGEIKELARVHETMQYTKEATYSEDNGTWHSGPGGVI